MQVPGNRTEHEKENNGEILSQNDSCEASLQKNQSQNKENQKALRYFKEDEINCPMCLNTLLEENLVMNQQ